MKSNIINIVAIASLMVAGGAMAVDMPELAKKMNCTACHAVERKIVGPAWMDVSKKYKGAVSFEYNGKDYPLMEGLMMKVSKGGSGHWGSMPMPANDGSGSKQAEIKELVTFMLGLAK
jgi:cytochrome c551/c552